MATQGQGADAETLQAIVEAQAKAKLDAARKAAEDMLGAAGKTTSFGGAGRHGGSASGADRAFGVLPVHLL